MGFGMLQFLEEQKSQGLYMRQRLDDQGVHEGTGSRQMVTVLLV